MKQSSKLIKMMMGAIACLTLGTAQMVSQNAPVAGQEQQTGAEHQRHMRGGKMDRMGGGKHMQRMAAELGLTDAQKTQIKSIHEQQRTKAQELRQNESLTKEQKMEQFKALRESTQTQVNGVLTPEQQQKFTSIKSQRKERMGKHHMGKHRKAHRGAGGEKAGKVDEQKTQEPK